MKEYRRKLNGRYLSEETRKKLNEARPKGKRRLGYISSLETRKKLSEAHKGKKLSEETKRKIGLANSIAMKGIHHSEEHKKKISESLKGRHLSETTKRKLSEAHKGEKSYLWKGGISSKNDKARHNIEMRLWRRSIMERDSFTCQKYGIKGGKLVAHHINNFSEFPELRTAINNGITLSEQAHKEFHKKYGKKNNTREQLKEFLKVEQSLKN